jgi:carotenoid cleavage dioxygenase-like enzyme
MPELGTRFTVLDKATGAVAARAQAPACFAFHHVNAFETDGVLNVDIVIYPDAGIIEDLRLARLRTGSPVEATATLTRFRIPLGSEPEREPVRIEPEVLCSSRIELPRIDYARRGGRMHRYVWGAGMSQPGNFLDNITKIELADGSASRTRTWHSPGCYPGEPVFVAHPEGTSEDNGVLLSVVLDAQAGRSFLLVLDAATLEEQARARVPHHIPFGFHGNYFSDPAAATSSSENRGLG